MPTDHEPTETTRRPVTVILLHESGAHDRIEQSSYRAAVETVKERGSEAAAAKIEAADGEVVFRSDEMDIERWENEWKRAKRRLAVDVEEHECPYDAVGCFADDRCVQCQMDRVAESG